MIAVVKEGAGVVYEGGLTCFSKGCLPEHHHQEQEVASWGFGVSGTCICASHCFYISGLQDHCGALAAAGI